MLYLNSIQNAATSPIGRNYIICHLTRIPKLAPSKNLFVQWQSNTINWEEFCERFKDEMRAEYLNTESQLRKLTDYSLENDITLHSPEPSGEQTYRAILEEIINNIWEREGRTDRVINLAREPVEESQQAAIQELIEQNQSLVKQNGNLNRTNGQLREQINTHETTIDDLRQALSEKDRELKEQINTHETTIDDLRQALSEKDREIRSLNDTIGERDTENDGLNRRNRELEEQVNAHETTIDDLHQTLSEKEKKISNQEDKIESLETMINKLEEQVSQLQDINTHPKIRDIAVEAAGDDLEFKRFNIDEYLPIALEEWLETHLNQALGRRNVNLYNLIDNHIDFEEEKLNPDERDYSDRDLVYVIKTQRNVLAHPGEMNKKTRMARVLCCFFAAALLPSKRPKPKQRAFRE